MNESEEVPQDAVKTPTGLHMGCLEKTPRWAPRAGKPPDEWLSIRLAPSRVELHEFTQGLASVAVLGDLCEGIPPEDARLQHGFVDRAVIPLHGEAAFVALHLADLGL